MCAGVHWGGSLGMHVQVRLWARYSVENFLVFLILSYCTNCIHTSYNEVVLYCGCKPVSGTHSCLTTHDYSTVGPVTSRLSYLNDDNERNITTQSYRYLKIFQSLCSKRMRMRN
jgi:hypothetical protein